MGLRQTPSKRRAPHMGFSLRATSLALVLGVALLGGGVASSGAAEQGADRVQRVPAGGAPPAGSGTVVVRDFVRVVDGDTFEVLIGGYRAGVGVIGIEAPQLTTDCGAQAAEKLARLVQDGVRLVESGRLTFDDDLRRLYYAETLDRRSIARKLVKKGLAHPTGEGKEKKKLRKLAAEAEAEGRGCLYGGDAAARSAPARGEGEAPGTSAELAPGLPAGFVTESVVGGLDSPTSFAHLPDGRILIAEKSGTVRIVKNGALLSTPFIDIRDRVNAYWDRGLLGIAVDPDFGTNGFVYLLYTYENNAASFDGPKTARLTRVTTQGDTASPSTETVILGTKVGRSCSDFPVGADCIPSDGPSHTVGAVKFAPDKTMFVSVGDAANFNTVNDAALRAQNLDSLAGKILHVNRQGAGLSTNPFYTGDTAANRSKLWALGVRNAYRFNLRPGTGDTLYVGDVGWSTWEEVDVARRGANLGWPCYEGAARQAGYEPKAVCQTLYGQGAGAVTAPLVAYNHNGSTAAVTGGAFYTGQNYPSEYQGRYFYGDYALTFLRYLGVDASNTLTEQPKDLATGAGSPVDIEMGPDGNLWYLSIGDGALLKIKYEATGSGCPKGQYKAEYFGNRTLAGAPVFTRCETTIDNNWGAGGPGNGVPSNNFSVRWTGNHDFSAGDYTFSATADDGVRAFVDGTQIIDGWKDQSATTYTADKNMSAGTHAIKVEYYEKSFDAVAKFSWKAGVPDTGCPKGQYRADYFGNRTLAGAPVLTRCETTIDNNWGAGGPGNGIGNDNFSVRWTGNHDFSAGDYTFSATADDGVRAFVDGTQIIDGWKDQSATTYEASKTLGAGTHTVKVEYYENRFDAVAKFSWKAGVPDTGCPKGQYRADYFGNRTLAGAPVFTRCESTIDNNWGAGGPGNGIGNDNFSVRWTGNHDFTAGDYTFSATADDGVRAFLDGTQIIDGWKDQPPTNYAADKTVTAGTHIVKVEYYENRFDAMAKFSWGPPNAAPIATIDQPSPDFRYQVGDVISYSGSAVDPEDGTLSADKLRWNITIQHCPGGGCHRHLFIDSTGAGGSFTVPDHGDESSFEIKLTATDSKGRTGTQMIELRPKTVQVTLRTSPTGLQLVYDGTAKTAPATITSVAGSTHTLHAPSPQGNQTFSSWSDGGAQQHSVSLGTSDVTYTATFQSGSAAAGSSGPLRISL